MLLNMDIDDEISAKTDDKKSVKSYSSEHLENQVYDYFVGCLKEHYQENIDLNREIKFII